MNRFYGYLMVIISAAAFGAMPIFARYTYASGVDPISLLFFRFFIGAICMAVFLRLKKSPLPRGRDLVILILMGFVGYAGQSISYFTALIYIPAGLVAILLYLYPMIVTVLSVLFLKEKLSAQKLVALAMALAGTMMVVGLEFGGSAKGILWGVSAAFIYSCYIIAGTKAMRDSEPVASATVVIAAAAVSIGCLAFTRGLHLPGNLAGWCCTGTIAVVCTAIAIVAFFSGLKLIGPVDASLISTFEPVTTVVLAFMFLGEHIAFVQILGMMAILTAACLLARQSGRQVGKPDAFVC